MHTAFISVAIIQKNIYNTDMDTYNFDIQEELKKLPGRPGVYIMHDEKDNIIYVGKAISLKNRVQQEQGG